MHPIVFEYFKDYVSSSGLGRLSKADSLSLTALLGPVKYDTVMNENGILYISAFLLVCVLCGQDVSFHEDRYHATVLSLQHEKYPGLFLRQPGLYSSYEKQDNYVGIIAGSTIFDLFWPTLILNYGILHGGNYNNVDPNTYKIECQRQPGEMAFYAIASGLTPELFQFIYLMCGLLVNAFFTKGSSDSQLAWMRIETLTMVGIKPPFMESIFAVVKSIWKWRFKKRYGTLHQMFIEFYSNGDKNHPIIRLAKEFNL